MDAPVEKLFQYGLPTVLLAVFVVGLWKSGNKVTAWIKPIIEKVTSDHLDLVSALKTNAVETKETLSDINIHLAEQTQILKDINTKTVECPYKVASKLPSTINVREQ